MVPGSSSERWPAAASGAGARRASAAVVAVALAVAVLAATPAPPAGAGAPAAADRPVALHLAVGDTVSAAEAARFGLFADVPGFESAVFRAAPWGGYLVRLRARVDGKAVVRERNVPTATWRRWGERIEACLAGDCRPAEPAAAPGEGGAPAPPAPTPATPGSEAAAAPAAPAPALAVGAAARADTAASVRAPADTALAAPGPVVATADTTGGARPPEAARPWRRPLVWPEAPLPPPRARLRVARDSTQVPTYPALAGRWLVSAGLGYRHCLTDWRTFFTDMGLFEVVVQNQASSRLTPYFSFQVGFGDIPDDFEKIVVAPDGSHLNGRSALYALEVGSLLRARAGAHSDAYVGLGCGYYMRSLRWGSDATFVDIYGNLYSPSWVREIQDWGLSTRAGWRKQYKTRGGHVRLLDVQARWESYAASSLSAEPSAFRASGRDQWLALSVSLIGGF